MLGLILILTELYKVGIITPKEDTELLGNLPTAGADNSWICLTPKFMLILLQCISSPGPVWGLQVAGPAQ